MEVDMYKLFAILILWIFFIPNLYADNYIASRQELWFSDSSYYKTSHHIKIGKSVMFNNYHFFGEVGIGEDIDEGTPVGSGSSFDYIRFGVSKTFFDSFKVKKDKKISRKERRQNNDLRYIKSIEDAEDWEEVEKEDKY